MSGPACHDGCCMTRTGRGLRGSCSACSHPEAGCRLPCGVRKYDLAATRALPDAGELRTPQGKDEAEGAPDHHRPPKPHFSGSAPSRYGCIRLGSAWRGTKNSPSRWPLALSERCSLACAATAEAWRAVGGVVSRRDWRARREETTSANAESSPQAYARLRPRARTPEDISDHLDSHRECRRSHASAPRVCASRRWLRPCLGCRSGRVV